jgi:hypothetical protein
VLAVVGVARYILLVSTNDSLKDGNVFLYAMKTYMEFIVKLLTYTACMMLQLSFGVKSL